MRLRALGLMLVCGLGVSAESALAVTLTPLGTYQTGYFEQGGSEIPTFDPLTRRGFVVNAGAGTVDVVNLAQPANPVLVRSINVASACGLPVGSKPNSVDVKLGIVAVAVEAPVKQDPGYVAIFSSLGANKCLGTAVVGALPDMVTFSPDGRYILTANEGEPNADYSMDPEGSVSVIDLLRLGRRDLVRTASFQAYNSPAERSKLLASGVRLFGLNASTAQDLEPEYIAISGNKAYVTLQEANALAVVNISQAKVEKIIALGRKDYSLPGQGLDASDRDGPGNSALINIANWPVAGMYMPDSIAALTWKNRTYLVTANEGDAREYGSFVEEIRIGSSGYVLDPVQFPNAAALKANAALGRLNASRFTGDTDGDGDFDRIDVFGARSISIWDDAGKLVWDSGDALEQEVARLFPSNFNAGHTTNALDDRSDNKGPEPEGLAVGQVGGRTYAFVGLERLSGIAAFDVSNPTAPVLATLVANRDFSQPVNQPCIAPATGNCPNPAAGDLGPEGLHFVPAWQSPTRKALLVVGNEVSGTTTVWQVE